MNRWCNCYVSYDQCKGTNDMLPGWRRNVLTTRIRKILLLMSVMPAKTRLEKAIQIDLAENSQMCRNS